MRLVPQIQSILVLPQLLNVEVRSSSQFKIDHGPTSSELLYPLQRCPCLLLNLLKHQRMLIQLLTSRRMQRTKLEFFDRQKS